MSIKFTGILVFLGHSTFLYVRAPSSLNDSLLDSLQSLFYLAREQTEHSAPDVASSVLKRGRESCPLTCWLWHPKMWSVFITAGIHCWLCWFVVHWVFSWGTISSSLHFSLTIFCPRCDILAFSFLEVQYRCMFYTFIQLVEVWIAAIPSSIPTAPLDLVSPCISKGHG